MIKYKTLQIIYAWYTEKRLSVYQGLIIHNILYWSHKVMNNYIVSNCLIIYDLSVLKYTITDLN